MADRTLRPSSRNKRTRWTPLGRSLSASEIARHAAVVIGGVLAFALSLLVSLAGAYGAVRPAVALKATPFDAASRAKLAQQLASSGAPELANAAVKLARDAIRRDPLQPTALAVLGQVSSQREASGMQSALHVMLQAEKLSRRERAAQMWLIDYYIRRNDLAAAVRHFDIALRTSDSSRSSIFPLLDVLAADPRARPVLMATLATRPNWTVPFAVYSADNGQDLAFAASVARLLLKPADEMDRGHLAALLQRLLAAQKFDLAWSLYTDPRLQLAVGPITSLRNPAFEKADGVTPFDWTFAQEPDLWAARERQRGNGSVLRLAAANGRSGTVAKQILHLAPGPHHLSAKVGDVPVDAFERPLLRVQCATVPEGPAGENLLSIRPAQGGSGVQVLSGGFAVPATCRYQRLSIGVAGTGPLHDPLPWIDDLVIESQA